MAASVFGIVYAAGSKMIRRIIVPDRDDELKQHALGPGEIMLVAPSGPHDLFTCQDIVKAATGVQPADPRCAVVDKTGLVVKIIAADPALDVHPAGDLVACYAKGIDVGCTLDGKTGLFKSPEVIMKAGTVDRITKQPRATDMVIPASVIAKPVAAAIDALIDIP